MREASRTTRAECGLQLRQTSSRSVAAQVASIPWSRRYWRICASTRSAVRRSASSRRAMRLPLRKNDSTARPACSAM